MRNRKPRVVVYADKIGGMPMLEIFKTVEDGIRTFTMDNIEPGCWVNLIHPTHYELLAAEALTKAPSDFIRAALDPEETSRIETEDDQVLILVNVPVDREDGNDEYDTIPLGIVITPDYIVTICQKENAIFDAFTKNRYRSFCTFKRTRFLFQLLYRSAAMFLKDLRQITRKSDAIEKDLRKSMKNVELFQLLGLQKGLTYYSISLRSNKVVVERLLRICSNPSLAHIIKIREEDEDLLDDVRIEYDQGIEMAQVQTDVLAGMMDAFGSVISNNLNIVMKFLASVTIVMSIPTLVASLWGMNVPVPWQGNTMGFVYAMLVAVVISAVTVIVLWRKDFF